MSPERHRYRYAATVRVTLDDVHGVGPEGLIAALGAVVRVVPARVVAGQVDVDLDELGRLDADDQDGGAQ